MEHNNHDVVYYALQVISENYKTKEAEQCIINMLRHINMSVVFLAIAILKSLNLQIAEHDAVYLLRWDHEFVADDVFQLIINKKYKKTIPILVDKLVTDRANISKERAIEIVNVLISLDQKKTNKYLKLLKI